MAVNKKSLTSSKTATKADKGKKSKAVTKKVEGDKKITAMSLRTAMRVQ